MRIALAACAVGAGPAIADVTDFALDFANCVGQADAYIAEASKYADIYVVIEGNEANFAAILPAINDVPAAEAARRQGKADWNRRAKALKATGGDMSGPAWDATVEATLHCDTLRLELVSAGILKEAGQ